MQAFAFEARTEIGELTTGMLHAADLEDAGRQLSQRNLFVVRLAADNTRVRRASVRGRATRAEVAWQMTQLSIMVKTGVRLSDALECMARQTTRPRFKALQEHVYKCVQEGRLLSEAMAMFPRSYPPSLIAMIRASEMSGTMSLVLHRASTYLINDLKVIKRIRSALLYPAFMLFACLLVTVFLLTVILPRFAAIFESRGAILPLPTRMLMAMSNSLVGHWYLWLGGAVALALLTVIWQRTRIGRLHRDYALTTLPLFSNVFNGLYQSRAFRTLAVLLDAGVSLTAAMQVIRDIVPNAYYRDLWQSVDDHIQRGERMSAPILDSPLIPESIAQMIDSGERAGKLGYVFGQLADFTEDAYDQAVKTATQFIEPCMILFMGTSIGFVAASLMLPMFQSSLIMTR